MLVIPAMACALIVGSGNMARAGGKLEAAVEGGKLALEYGEKLGKLLTGLDRSATIVIANHSNRKLSGMRVYADSGKIVDLQNNTSIAADDVGGVTAEKSDSALAGAVGIITYNIEGTTKKLLILYSVPYNQTEAGKDSKNWFLALVVNGADYEAGKKDFYHLYDNSSSLRQAGRGVEKWEVAEIADQAAFDAAYAKLPPADRVNAAKIIALQQRFERVRWRMEGTMVNAGQSKIYIDFYED